MTLMFIMTSTFISYYYTDVVGIDAAIVGTVILAARLLNAFTDIGSGVLIERTKNRHDKARPWNELRLNITYHYHVFMM